MTLLKYTKELQMTGLVNKMKISQWVIASVVGLSALMLQNVSYAAAGDIVQTITSTNSYDTNGNVTVVDVSTTVNEPNGVGGVVAKTYTKKTINSYSNIDVAAWRLGWVNCSVSWVKMPYDSNLADAETVSGAAISYVYNTTGANVGQPQNKVTGPIIAISIPPNACYGPYASIAITTSYSYDIFGNVLSEVISGADFASRTTSSTYDPTGRFVKTNTNALNQTENLDYYYDKGLLKSQTGPNGLTTAWEYDEIGRKKKETRSDGTYTLVTYSNCDATCDSSTNEKYKITTTNYRANGTLIDAADTAYYDQLNRPLRGTTTSFDNKTLIAGKKVYNTLGQVVETYANHNLPLVSGDSLANYKTTISYDALGRPLQTTEASGRTSKASYVNSFTTTTTIYPTTNTTTGGQKKTENKNGLGRLVEVVDNANNSLKYIYDIKGNLRKTIDAKNNIIEMQYNLLGQKTKMIDPDMGTWSYTYNLLGDLLTQKDNKQQTTTMTYDKLGRILTRLEPDLTSTWVYDTAAKGIGQLTSVSSTNGFSRNYGYDSLGRPITSTTTIDSTAYTVSNSYDDAGRSSSFTYPTGVGYTNIYDSNGYLQRVQDKNTQSNYWTVIKRDAAGNVTEEKLGNGLTTRRTYKPTTGYVDTIQTGTGSGTSFSAAVQNNSYSFDNYGNLNFRTEALNNVSEGFVYDNLNRLVQSTMGTTTKTVSYDALGRIYSKSDAGSYSYGQGLTIPNPSYNPNWTPYNTWVPIGMGNGLPIFVFAPVSRPTETLTVASAGTCGGIHRVCSIGGAVNSTFTYDANGNMLTGNGRSYTWNSFNMPASITQGTNTESFIYDANHDRVKRTSVESGGTTTTVYLNPRLDLGGTFEKNINPDNSIEYVHHLYAGGQVLGSVVTKSNYSSPTALWSTDLTTAPTTTSPNATGLTLPAVDTNGLIAWDNTTGNGRLAFITKPTTVSMNVIAMAQRSYLNDNVLFKAEVTTTANIGTGRYLLMEVFNNGSDAAASKTNRRHGVYIRGGNVYAYYSDGVVVNSTTGNLTSTTKTLGAAADNTTYVAEVETTPLSSTLYVYPKGQTRASGYSHSLDMDWRSLNGTGTLARRMRVFAYGNTTESVNVTYLDNVSESTFTPLGTRYFHTDHLGSMSAITNSAGAVIERLSYDAWGKRRAITGADANGIKGTTTKHGFTGHEALDTVGLVHMNGRVYDPVVGRFISADPNVFYPKNMQDYNRYSYVHNNPLSFVDPSGFEMVCQPTLNSIGLPDGGQFCGEIRPGNTPAPTPTSPPATVIPVSSPAEGGGNTVTLVPVTQEIFDSFSRQYAVGVIPGCTPTGCSGGVEILNNNPIVGINEFYKGLEAISEGSLSDAFGQGTMQEVLNRAQRDQHGNIDYRRDQVGTPNFLNEATPLDILMYAFPVLAEGRLFAKVGVDGLTSVTSWASKGTTVDFIPPRWVMLGEKTTLNFNLTGLPGGKFYGDSLFSPSTWRYVKPIDVDITNAKTIRIDPSQLRWPTFSDDAFGPIKGLVGQRIIME